MSKLVQCIPNFSTMQEETGIAIAEAIANAGALVMDRHWDVDHARTVVTFAGSPESVRTGMLAGAVKAGEVIDLREHQGEHPRLGAVDVIPVVPIRDVTMEECVELSYSIGNDLADKLNLPVYFYERSAKQSNRTNLAEVRKGGFEALLQTDLTGMRKPDLGPLIVHPKAGAVIVGARGPLIAFNVNLESQDISIAKKIASKMRRIRDSEEGMTGVKAIGISLSHKKCVQVSTNITLPDQVSMYDVLTFVEREAASSGVAVREVELIGMVRLKYYEESAVKSSLIQKAVRHEAILDYRLPL